MISALKRLNDHFGRWFRQKSVSVQTLGKFALAAFVLSLLPLVIIAFYNYPADDDFSFVFPVAQTWVRTRSLWSTLQAICAKTYDIYMTWQGNFVSTALFNVTPLVFNLDLYFISSWGILALLCLSVGYAVKGVVHNLLGAGRWTFWVVYTAVITLMIQFMPSIGYGVYWHNGGMYTVAACMLFLLQGLLARGLEPQTRKRAVWRGVCAALCGLALGGSFYGPMLGALVLVALETAAAFCRRSKNRAMCAVALAFFAAAMVVSVIAPGNVLRQERTGEALSPVVAVITALTDSFDVAGRFLTPQLLAALMLIVPALWQPLKRSGYAFRHPFWVFVMFYGLFSATLAPGLYTGFGYTTERYYNVIYFYFILMIVAGTVYAEGALIRRLERREDSPVQVGGSFGQRFTALYLTVCLALLGFGGCSYTIMNTASLSAAKSLATGGAAAFRQEMTERELTVLQTSEAELTGVEPLGHMPHVFKEDKLPWQGVYGRLLYQKWYYELFFYAGLRNN